MFVNVKMPPKKRTIIIIYSSTVLKRKRLQLENINSITNQMDESVSKAVGCLAFAVSKRKSTNRKEKPIISELSKDVRQETNPRVS